MPRWFEKPAQPRFDPVRPDLHRHAMEKYRNQAPVAHFHQTPLAPLEIETCIPREIAMHN